MKRLLVLIVGVGLGLAGWGVTAPAAQADGCDGQFTRNGNVFKVESVETTVLGGGDWEGVQEDNTGAWVEYRGWTNVNQLLLAVEHGDPEGAVTPDDGHPLTVEAGTGEGSAHCSDTILDEIQDPTGS